MRHLGSGATWWHLLCSAVNMPDKQTIERVKKDKRQGKSASTQAGEFVREDIHHVREGKHGARSTEQAIAIGLSKARRAGVKLPPPKKGSAKMKAATHSYALASLARIHSFTVDDFGATLD